MKWDSCQGLLLPSRVCARTQRVLQFYSRVVAPSVGAAGMQVNAMVGASLVEAGVVKAAGTPFVNGAIKLVGNNLVGVIYIHCSNVSVVVRNHTESQCLKTTCVHAVRHLCNHPLVCLPMYSFGSCSC
jgi:hypothetical protein